MNDSVVLVTGGAGNLGRSVTRAFAERGARVAVPIYKAEGQTGLEEVQERFGDRIFTFALDLTTERGAEEAIREVVEWGGRLDSVAHLVGGYSGGQLVHETDVEAWDRMIDLNLKSAWLVARFAVPALLESGGGSLVFVGSRAARAGRKGHAAYAVAKSGLLTLVEALSEEYRDQRIRANAVLPGIIDTAANRRRMPDSDFDSWTPPEEIARAIVFLASPDAAAISGAAIPAYGRS